ncbi:MAG: histidinol-phosphate transaminase [Spirochaetaceae bacterium]|jgi:histidinol-phosphate aminotransferase|uniref:Histidinol-phosphate aminotransferase n=1 Tax=Sphaerochaeta halotolerans TaxID=2293840 RepID=A0A372MF98_9SPIR|nr:histidinol-phosphate transaminase [Sphaerochaeta halotolerans]MBG0766894.1 histidinol-phosphate transaminase [Spirochaetaceae bacterium]MDN5334101.1 histidinol-phosphate aminotransferase [Sphaerochaeta sp.]RFU94451.1 histidinol-phosphate transaminase [Sphaerochaeta halotolerans]
MRELLRKNIANLTPYSCARNDFTGEAQVYLDANENWQDFVEKTNANRYPDPLSVAVRKQVEAVLGLPFPKTVLGNGSDELIDNLFRCFCEPGKDSVLLMPPTYGAYKVFADINDVRVSTVSLTPSFQIDFPALSEFLHHEKENRSREGRLKLLFICSPNNPSGNAFPLDEVKQICELFDGIIVVDEAYYDFSEKESAVKLLDSYPNVVVLRTLSKCWGLASARVGIAVAHEEIVSVFRSMKYPYNIGTPSQELALKALSHASEVERGLRLIKEERERLGEELKPLACVQTVFPSDANFFLVRVTDALAIYHYLAGLGIIVRNRSKELHCENCLRITVGSREENDRLLSALSAYKER